jgi:hypothetical protein
VNVQTIRRFSFEPDPKEGCRKTDDRIAFTIRTVHHLGLEALAHGAQFAIAQYGAREEQCQTCTVAPTSNNYRDMIRHHFLKFRERLNYLRLRIQKYTSRVKPRQRSRWLPSYQPGLILRQEPAKSCPWIYDEPDEGRMFLFLGKFIPLGAPETKAHLEAVENNQFLLTLDSAWGELHYYYLIKDSRGIWYAISKKWDPKMYLLGRTKNVTYRNLRWLIKQFYKPPAKRAERPWFGL